MPSFESLHLDLKATRCTPPARPDLFDGGTTAATRPPPSLGTVGGGALWDVAAAASRSDQDDTASDCIGNESSDQDDVGVGSRNDTSVKPFEDDETFEVVCPACTLMSDICAVKCRGCGGSLADAELAEM
jgi:hypothetical protein